MRKLMFEALAAWLALTAVCTQACAAVQQTGANINNVPTVTSSANGFSVADDLRFGRKGVYGTDSKRRAFDRRDVADALQGVLIRTNGGSGRIEAIRTVRNEDSEAATVSLLPGPKVVPETMVGVPEPGSWGTALAGLLGVIAIARRRMSL